VTTGWPPGLLQDDCRGLSIWLASRGCARLIVDAVGAEIQLKRRTDMQLPIEPLLCLSTSHITQETCDQLVYTEYREGWPSIYPNEYGAFIPVHTCASREAQGPPDLAYVLDFARANNIQWIKFDPDGHVIDDLPTYEWI
jgi:hypothetical protein